MNKRKCIVTIALIILLLGIANGGKNEDSNKFFIEFADECFSAGDITLQDKNGHEASSEEIDYFCDLYYHHQYAEMKQFLLEKGYSFGNK